MPNIVIDIKDGEATFWFSKEAEEIFEGQKEEEKGWKGLPIEGHERIYKPELCG